MRKRFPFIGVTPAVLEGRHIKNMGSYARLFDYLVHRQTSPDGTVNYGRPLTHARIAKELELTGPDWTPKGADRWVRRGIARLREKGYAKTRTIYRGCSVVGITVKVLKPKKWALQLRLFGEENVVAFGQGASTKLAGRSTRAVGGALAISQGGGSSAVERGPTRAEVAGSNPAPRSKGLRAGESRGASMLENQRQKSARLEREIQTIFGNYPGTLDLPEHTERKLRELTRELGVTRELIREYELGLGQKAG